MKNIRAKDIMSKDVVWVTETTSVAEAANLFMEEMITGAPVVNDKGVMTGVVSLRDFVKNGMTTERFVPDGDKKTVYYEESWDLPLSEEEARGFHLESHQDLQVREIMTPVLFNADVNTPVADLAQMMLRGRIHRVIVLDGDELAGIVTTMDMLKVICELV